MTKKKERIIALIGVFILMGLFIFVKIREPKLQDADILLSEGWHIQSSAKVSLDGVQLSTEGTDFGTDWYPASVPATVMGALTANGLYADAFTGKNYAEIDREQFDTTWWYRTSFEVPALKDGQRAELAFD